MTQYAPDIAAFLGLLLLSVGVYLVFGLGWAFIVGGSGAYATAILTVLANAAFENRDQRD